ncbi:PTS sugar transporter subunit IIA [candidate division KSB1 bacterium]
MKLTDILNVSCIKIPLKAANKEEVLEELVAILCESDKIRDRSVVLEAVKEREKTLSTGLENGIAIPHGKSSGVTNLVASFGISTEGIDFDSIDGEKSYIFFMLVNPEGPAGPHVKALSRISRVLSKEQFRQKLLNAESSEEIHDLIKEEENKYFEI